MLCGSGYIFDAQGLGKLTDAWDAGDATDATDAILRDYCDVSDENGL